MLSFYNNGQKLVLILTLFHKYLIDIFHSLCFDFVTVFVYKQSTTTQRLTRF
jgi:hypothetical protein